MESVRSAMPKGWKDALIKAGEGLAEKCEKIELLNKLFKNRKWDSHSEIRDMIKSSTLLTSLSRDPSISRDQFKIVVRNEAVHIIAGGTLSH